MMLNDFPGRKRVVELLPAAYRGDPKTVLHSQPLEWGLILVAAHPSLPALKFSHAKGAWEEIKIDGPTNPA